MSKKVKSEGVAKKRNWQSSLADKDCILNSEIDSNIAAQIKKELGDEIKANKIERKPPPREKIGEKYMEALMPFRHTIAVMRNHKYGIKAIVKRFEKGFNVKVDGETKLIQTKVPYHQMRLFIKLHADPYMKELVKKAEDKKREEEEAKRNKEQNQSKPQS